MVADFLVAGRSRIIDRQHCQIEALVEALESRFDSHRKANRSLVSLMNSLAVHLQMHFEMEEEDTYIALVAQRCSILADEIDRIFQQHNHLLKEVSRLVESAREAFNGNLETAELAERFRLFRKQLLCHEREEVNFLHAAYAQGFGEGG
jgi:hemerythrin